MQFIVSAIGLVFIYRIFALWGQKKILTTEKIQNCFVFVGSIHVIFAFLTISHLLFTFIFVCFEVLVLILAPLALENYRRTQFHVQSLAFLDLLILSMKGGRSFREALVLTKASENRFGFYFTEIIESLLQKASPKSMDKNPDVLKLFLNLSMIEKENHRILDRLSALRFSLRSELWMKGKIHQALAQARAQSYVMTAVYILLLFFSFRYGGIKNHPQLVAFSIFLYVTGAYFLWNLGRSYKWKI